MPMGKRRCVRDAKALAWLPPFTEAAVFSCQPEAVLCVCVLLPSVLCLWWTHQVTPKRQLFTFKTERKVPKTGLMLVGWGGNNGTTVTAGRLVVHLGGRPCSRR